MNVREGGGGREEGGGGDKHRTNSNRRLPQNLCDLKLD